jgi:GTPase SAR1 family protein
LLTFSGTLPALRNFGIRFFMIQMYSNLTSSVMTSSYFSGASAVIAVFDVSKSESFAAVPKWLEEARTFTEKYVRSLLEST